MKFTSKSKDLFFVLMIFFCEFIYFFLFKKFIGWDWVVVCWFKESFFKGMFYEDFRGIWMVGFGNMEFLKKFMRKLSMKCLESDIIFINQ